MRIAVDAGALAEATTVFERTNQSAAVFHRTLTTRLGRCAGMAGDSATAATFAEAYDEAAAAAVGAVGDVVEAFAVCARLAATSRHHHARADARSVVSGAVVYEGSLPSSGCVSVMPTTPPSSLGGDASGVPDWAGWILDQVEGFVWPDGDVDRLRAGAAAWAAAGRAVEDLSHACRTAVGSLSATTSPEVPVAVSVTEHLAAQCSEVAEQCAVLADACASYAGHVEEQRAAVLDLVHDLLRDAVVVQGIGIVLGFVTAGTTAAGAAAINAARIAAAAPRFLHVVSVLRTLAASCAAPLRLASTSLGSVRRELVVFKRARRALGWTYDAERMGRVQRLSVLSRHPSLLKPEDLRGLSRDQVAQLCEGWVRRPASKGVGWVYEVPGHYGKQIRVMEAYAQGTRPEAVTLGDYAVVSYGDDWIKVPLEGNPVL